MKASVFAVGLFVLITELVIVAFFGLKMLWTDGSDPQCGTSWDCFLFASSIATLLFTGLGVVGFVAGLIVFRKRLDLGSPAREAIATAAVGSLTAGALLGDAIWWLPFAAALITCAAFAGVSLIGLERRKPR